MFLYQWVPLAGSNPGGEGLPKMAVLQITDINGRTVMDVSELAYERIDISELSAGVYFVTVTGEGFYERVKLVKE